MAFILNPYNVVLDLNQKDNRKLFKDESKGLKEKDKFDGKRENYVNFTKLVKVSFDSMRAMETLNIRIKWTGAVKQPKKILNHFKDKNISKQQVKKYTDLVWCDTNHTTTAQLFRTFHAEPLNDVELTTARNAHKIKSMMGGSKTWNSLTSKYQLEILPNEDDFKRQGEFDLPLI